MVGAGKRLRDAGRAGGTSQTQKSRGQVRDSTVGHQRSEKALVLAMMEMAANGVSTRKVKRITDELCGKAFGKSTVSFIVPGQAG